MGKLLSGAITVILMTGVLSALTISGAQADPYPGTVNTRCIADNLNNPRVGNPAKVRFRVATAGNARPRGIVTFQYERRRSEFIVKEYTRRYRGPEAAKYAFYGIPSGRYLVRVFFNSRPADSVFQNCRTDFTQRVRPRR